MIEYPDELKSKENKEVNNRRSAAGVEKSIEHKVGIAYSGGGIRSATLCLGITQALAKLDLLKHVDFMSTVSGGGYFGSFLGKLFNYQNHEEVKKSLLEDSPQIKYLRDGSNYLAPNGEGDIITGISVLIRNWFSLMSVIMCSVLTIFLIARGLSWSYHTIEVGNHLMSPFVALIPLIFLFALIPCVWAYWFIKSEKASYSRLASFLMFIATGGSIWLQGVDDSKSLIAISITAVFTWVFYLFSYFKSYKKDSLSQRSILSSWLSQVTLFWFVVVVFSIIDTLGLMLYSSFSTWQISGLGATSAFVTGAVALSRKLLTFKIKKSISFTLNVVGFLPVGLFLVSASAISYTVLWKAGPIVSSPSHWPLVITFVLTVILSFLWGSVWAFVNRSSFHAFFEERITRTFLGAANPERLLENYPVNKVHNTDNVAIKDYHPEKNGGPLHIINVTINETIDGKSQLQQTHRRGLNMAITPLGISVGAKHHALWNGEALKAIKLPKGYHKVFDSDVLIYPETLSLGQWIALSAAAASTAMGYKTTVFKSVLFIMFNVRLGYWWNSGVGRIASSFFGVQRALLKEALARFPGTIENRWYLSDGGHFENSSCYELFRRNLPVIILCDNGRDSNCEFWDLSNTIRKARIDFGVEIDFMTEKELDENLDPSIRNEFGTPEQMQRLKGTMKRVDINIDGEKEFNIEAKTDRYSKCHASLASVTYKNGDKGVFVYLKPTLTGDETMDVIQYDIQNESFPHDATSDQSFDEPQWESYRKLGMHYAMKIFGPNQKNTPNHWIKNKI